MSWVCYLIASLESNQTYIGASNNQPNRLNAHNSKKKSRKGAKYTCGQSWVPVVVISGFLDKKSCLSWEAGWKRLARKRKMDRLIAINSMTPIKYKYSQDTIWKRIMDLLYFSHNISYLDTKYAINYDIRHPVIIPPPITILFFNEDIPDDIPWPYYVNTIIN